MIISFDVKGIQMNRIGKYSFLGLMNKGHLSIQALFYIGVLSLFLASCAKDPVIAGFPVAMEKSRIPVILDTDIGDDIDDTWALAFLLNCPEFDVKLIVSATGDTVFRAKVIAKMLERCNRTEIPIGIGKPTPSEFAKPFGNYNGHPYYQRTWVNNFNMADYKGKVYNDGIDAMIEMIMKSDEPITVIAIGPLPNLAEALRRQPLVAEKSKVVGMLGSIRRGYNNSGKLAREWNVATYVDEAQIVFNSPWSMMITPLDTCGIVKLVGKKYRRVAESKNPVAEVVLDAYQSWLERPGYPPEKRWDINQSSSTLYDTVAIYLAMSTDLFKMEEVEISVDTNGYTLIDNNAKTVNCAMEWKDLNAFEEFLVSRIVD